MRSPLFPLLARSHVSRLLRGGIQIEPTESELLYAASCLAQLGIITLTKVQTIRCANPPDDDFPDDVIDESCEGVVRLGSLNENSTSPDAGAQPGSDYRGTHMSVQCQLCGRFIEYAGSGKQLFTIWETSVNIAGLHAYAEAANLELTQSLQLSTSLSRTVSAQELLTESRSRLRQRISRHRASSFYHRDLPRQQSKSSLQEIHDSLLKAFPSKESLERMLKYELDINLNEIAANGTLNEIVHAVIVHAESRACLSDLINAAKRSNSGNEQLAQLDY